MCLRPRGRRLYSSHIETKLCEMIHSAESENWEKENNECLVKHQSIKMEIKCLTISSSSLLKGFFQLVNGGLCDFTD